MRKMVPTVKHSNPQEIYRSTFFPTVLRIFSLFIHLWCLSIHFLRFRFEYVY